VLGIDVVVLIFCAQDNNLN